MDSVVLTDRMCEKRVAKRSKSTTANAPASTSALPPLASQPSRSSSPIRRRQATHRLAWRLQPETFTVEHARSKVYGLKGMGGGALAETFRDRKVQQAKKGKTVDEIIEERIDWMKTLVPKRDGEMRPRIETWENVASHLRRFLSLRLGKKIAGDVTKNDIATLSNDIVAASSAFLRSPMPATCGARPLACSIGRRKLAATMSSPHPASTCRSWTMSIRATAS